VAVHNHWVAVAPERDVVRALKHLRRPAAQRPRQRPAAPHPQHDARVGARVEGSGNVGGAGSCGSTTWPRGFVSCRSRRCTKQCVALPSAGPRPNQTGPRSSSRYSALQRRVYHAIGVVESREVCARGAHPGERSTGLIFAARLEGGQARPRRPADEVSDVHAARCRPENHESLAGTCQHARRQILTRAQTHNASRLPATPCETLKAGILVRERGEAGRNSASPLG
jgi:hypothetical protein